MFKSKSFIIITVCTFLFGCSNSQNTKLSYTDVDTIKDYVKNRELDVTWTKEVEGGRLTEPITGPEKIENTDFLNPETVKILPVFQKPIYPAIEEFGSLDNSNLPPNIKKNITDFCSAIANNIYSGPEKFFDNTYIFNLVFFKSELIENWIKYFEEDFPVNPEDFETAKAAAEEVGKKEETSESEEKSEQPEENKVAMPDPIFTKWFLGEPFIGETLTEIPVRFFSNNGSIDVTIFIKPNSENSIYQIIIDRWKKTNDE